jgi:CHAD domain-containing protein
MSQFFLNQSSHYQTIALLSLARLSNGDPHPEAVHTLRTSLRRSQASLELEGADAHAAVAGRCASRFSSLRALQVFHAYLIRHGAPKSDRAILQDAVHESWRDLTERQVCRKVERRLRRIPLQSPQRDIDALQERIASLYRGHADELKGLLDAAIKKPRRKRIHALRLKLKTIRYQEECLLGRRATRSHFLTRLREVLGRLGKYEELAEFRKQAKRLRLESRPAIVKDWRRVSKRTRSLLTELGWISKSLHGRKPHLAPEKPSTQLAG